MNLQAGKLLTSSLGYIPAISAAAIYFSILYHFGYFLLLKLSLISLFSLSDYVTNGIAFVPLTILYLAYMQFKIPRWFPHYDLEKIVPDTIDDLTREELLALQKRLKRRKVKLIAAQICLMVLLCGFLTSWWLLSFYPNWGLLLVMLCIPYIFGMFGVFEEDFVSLFPREYFDLVQSFLFVSVMCVLFGAAGAAGDLRKKPDVSIRFQSGEVANARMFRITQSYVIYADKKGLTVMPQAEVKAIRYLNAGTSKTGLR